MILFWKLSFSRNYYSLPCGFTVEIRRSRWIINSNRYQMTPGTLESSVAYSPVLTFMAWPPPQEDTVTLGRQWWMLAETIQTASAGLIDRLFWQYIDQIDRDHMVGLIWEETIISSLGLAVKLSSEIKKTNQSEHLNTFHTRLWSRQSEDPSVWI